MENVIYQMIEKGEVSENVMKKEISRSFQKTPYSKDVIVEHRGATIELKSTKRGIAMYAFNDTKFIKNGDQILAIPKNAEVFEFEKSLEE